MLPDIMIISKAPICGSREISQVAYSGFSPHHRIVDGTNVQSALPRLAVSEKMGRSAAININKLIRNPMFQTMHAAIVQLMHSLADVSCRELRTSSN